jgi:hypothetical protein
MAAQPTPGPVSVTPSGSAALSQVFTAVYDSATEGQILFANSPNPSGGCNARWNAGGFWLRNDNDNAWLGPATPSMPNLENLQCILSSAASSATAGASPTVNFALTFKPSFTGQNKIYLRALNDPADSGWVKKGDWTIGSLPQPPVNESVTPVGQTGLTQTFTITSSSPNGYPYIDQIGVIFNFAPRGDGACYAIYSQSSNTVALLNDAGTDVQGMGVVGAAGTVENSQCRIDLGNSFTQPSYNSMVLKLAITFKDGLPGPQNIYMYTLDNAWTFAQTQYMGTWTTTAVNSQGPLAVSVDPSSGSGPSNGPWRGFTYTARSVNGYQYIPEMYVLIGTSPTDPQACLIYFNRMQGLQINDGLGWSSPVLPGMPRMLQNDRCSVDAGMSSVSNNGGTDLTLNLSLYFNPSWTGAKNNYLYVNDRANNNTGWQTVGTWTVTVAYSQVVVPNVIGMPQNQATATIANLILVVPTPTQEYSSTIPAGNVVHQNPLPNTQVNAGSAVSLIVSAGPLPVSYSHSRQIVIHGSSVPGNLTNFPVLISGKYAYLATQANGGQVQNPSGYDIIFAQDPAGAQPLDHEIESYRPDGTISMWVRIPTLQGGQDTTIYMLYGNTAVTTSQENKAGVWINGFVGVWHLQNTLTAEGQLTPDSTSYNTPARADFTWNAGNQQPGQIGGSLLFNGGSPINAMDAPRFLAVAPMYSTPRTISTWVNKSDNSVGVVFGYAALNFYVDNQNLHFWSGGTYNDASSFDTGANLNLNKWSYVVFSYDGTGSVSVYVDGAFKKQQSVPALSGYGQALWGVDIWGTHGFPNQGWFKGQIDESRIAAAVRSADWSLPSTTINRRRIASIRSERITALELRT